ncbi:probable delta-aminolevulinic acid dehydratase 2, chloroplastic [Eutrema salsugineum]|uniref:probable delta-aminolevulinic acid dehydratase 2, chloroplastic n=1 Tax=Eutrema salsugineum TaxID=72664 RepID=UPI000CED078C|nr:probable delta-aminolevulinic acid dehydratase 2, chloroplastic [Eutrema salsugineum]
MTSSMSRTPCKIPAMKGFEQKSYVGLKAALYNVRTYPFGSTEVACRAVLIVSNGLRTILVACQLQRSDSAILSSINAREVFLVPSKPAVPPMPSKTAKPVIDQPLISRRARRNRKSPTQRAAFQETNISPENLIYPLFIHQGEVDIPIKTMPGRYMLGWRHGLIEEVARARDVGVNSIVLYPKVPDALKSPTGEEAFNDNGLVQRTVRLLKDKFPDLVIYTDVNFDEYSLSGHGGIIREDGVILNDETIHQLRKQAISQARAGADVVCTSEMLDGRVGAVRAALDAEGFHHVSIMSYSVKYTSSLYGRFRKVELDKKTYQINPANSREALIEAQEDEAEGADILMVKPAVPSLDIIRLLKDQTLLPVGACQVSGEYSMIKAAGLLKMIDEEKVMMESLICLRRAGADLILTYFALQAATVLCGEHRKFVFD